MSSQPATCVSLRKFHKAANNKGLFDNFQVSMFKHLLHASSKLKIFRVSSLPCAFLIERRQTYILKKKKNATLGCYALGGCDKYTLTKTQLFPTTAVLGHFLLEQQPNEHQRKLQISEA